MTEPAQAPTREEALQARLEAAQAKRSKLATSRNLEALEQSVEDEEALADLESAHPDGFAVVFLNAPISGCPGFVAASDCTNAEYKRYQSGVKVRVVNKAAEVDSGDGAAQLARSKRLYPDEETFKKMCEQRAGLESGLGQEIVARAQTRKADDAKK